MELCRLCFKSSEINNLESAFDVKNGIKIADAVEKICAICITEGDKLQEVCR